MPTIHQDVHRAWRAYRCDGILHHWQSRLVIDAGRDYLRMYGYAELGDPPRVLRVCAACAIHPERQADKNLTSGQRRRLEEQAIRDSTAANTALVVEAMREKAAGR